MSIEARSSEPEAGRPVPARFVVAALVAAYGLIVAVANGRNDVVTNDFTPRADWVLFGGDSGFPGDFGRNAFAGSVGLGIVFGAVALLVALVGQTPAARPSGVVTAVFSVVLVVTYRDSGNLLGAKPSAAAVLLAVALYLVASSLADTSAEPSGRESDREDAVEHQGNGAQDG